MDKLKLRMRAWLEEALKDSTSTQEFWQRACRFYGRPRKVLQRILDGKKTWEAWVKKHDQGSGGALKRQGCHKNMTLRRRESSKGCRQVGGGRKELGGDIKDEVRQWAEDERQHGHRLGCAVMYLMQYNTTQ